VSETVEKPEEAVDTEGSKKEFEERQRAVAESQGLGEGAVPEQRPQALTVSDDSPHSELTQKLIDANDPNVPDQNGPMDKAAYERAASKEQAKKAAKDSRPEGIHVGALLTVVGPDDSPWVGQHFSVNRVVSDRSPEDSLLRATGSPEQLYIVPQEVEATCVRGDRDGERIILNLDDVEVRKVGGGLSEIARR
jgi:hypothetical protein